MDLTSLDYLIALMKWHTDLTAVGRWRQLTKDERAIHASDIARFCWS